MLRSWIAAALIAVACLLAPSSVRHASAICPAQFLSSTISSDADCIFRDYNTDGIPSSGPWNPQKSDIRQWGKVIGSAPANFVTGLDESGSTNMLSIMQDKLTSVGSTGGEIDLPCGLIKVQGNLSLPVAASKNVSVRGGGSDCTEIWFSGGAYGFTATMGNIFSSFNMSGVTLSTDQTSGSTTALSLLQPHVSTVPFENALGYGPSYTISDVSYRGHDYYGAQTEYWTTAFYEQNISNINIYGGACNDVFQGFHTTCYSFNGLVSAQNYSVSLNLFGSFIENCNVGVYYGPFVQGITVNAGNLIGCKYGINTVAGTTAACTTQTTVGCPDQLTVTNSSFNTITCAICINHGFFNYLSAVGNGFIISAGIGIQVEGALNTIADNYFGAVITSGTNAITFPTNSVSGQGTKVIGNSFGGFGNAINVGAISSVAYVDANNFSGNTNDYNLASGSSATIINDTTPRNLSTIPACGSALLYDRFLQADATTPTYDGVAAGGGSEIVPILCQGAWKNH